MSQATNPTERLDRLEERVPELEHQIDQKDERIAKLGSQIEIRGESKAIENLWVSGLPVGKMMHNRKQAVKELTGRVVDIERGEVVANSSASVDPSDLLPIHNMYLSATNLKPDEHDLSANQEIAARLFPYLGQYAFSNEGRMILPSTKVTDILEREIATSELEQRLDVESPNANTNRRAMKFVGKFGSELIEFDDSQKTNRLVIDRDEWVAYTREVSDVTGTTDSTVNTTSDAVNAQETPEDGVKDVEEALDARSQGGDYGVVSTDGGTPVNS